MNILILPGDGIGPEITTAMMTVLQAVNKRFALPLTFTTEEIGLASLKKRGALFQKTYWKPRGERTASFWVPSRTMTTRHARKAESTSHPSSESSSISTPTFAPAAPEKGFLIGDAPQWIW